MPINHPACSGGLLILMQGSAEPVLSVDLQVHDLSWSGGRFRQRAERGGLAKGPVRPMPAAERFELAERVQEVALVPAQGAIQQLPAAGR